MSDSLAFRVLNADGTEPDFEAMKSEEWCECWPEVRYSHEDFCYNADGSLDLLVGSIGGVEHVACPPGRFRIEFSNQQSQEWINLGIDECAKRIGERSHDLVTAHQLVAANEADKCKHLILHLKL